MTEPDGSVTDSESAGPGAAPAATQARWVAVARCRGARAPVTETPLRPPGRTAGESEPVFIFAQSSQRPTRSQLSDLKARGRDESRRAAAGDWAGVRRAAETGWGVRATDGLVPHAWRAWIEKRRFRGFGWRLARFNGHVCP